MANAKPKTVKVVCLTHSYFVDVRPKTAGKHDAAIQFHDHDAPHPEPEQRAKGLRAILGIADVPEPLVEEFYEHHPSFALLDELADDVDDVEKIDAPTTVDGDDEEKGVEGEGDGGGEEETEDGDEEGDGEEEKIREGEIDSKGTPNPLAGVDFASDNAMELAAELGLTAETMGKVRPTSKGGAYTVPDVRKASKKRAAASE